MTCRTEGFVEVTDFCGSGRFRGLNEWPLCESVEVTCGTDGCVEVRSTHCERYKSQHQT